MQRAVIWEVDEETGARSIVNIIEWPEDRLDLNKRRLMRLVKENCYDATEHHLMIIQKGRESAEDVTIYERTIGRNAAN